MKAAILALTLILSTAALAETPNPADYNIAVHVVSSRLVLGYQSQSQDLTVVIDGKRFEL